jgi:hypothetical protein
MKLTSTLVVAPFFAAATWAKTQAPIQERRGERNVAMGKSGITRREQEITNLIQINRRS